MTCAFIYEKYHKANEEAFLLHMLSRKRIKDKTIYLKHICTIHVNGTKQTNTKSINIGLLTSIIRKAGELQLLLNVSRPTPCSNLPLDSMLNFHIVMNITSLLLHVSMVKCQHIMMHIEFLSWNIKPEKGHNLAK